MVSPSRPGDTTRHEHPATGSTAMFPRLEPEFSLEPGNVPCNSRTMLESGAVNPFSLRTSVVLSVFIVER